MKIQLPEWCLPFAEHHKYKCAYGGRASSKTWSFAHLLVLDAVRSGHHKIYVCREFAAGLYSSSHAAIRTAIERMGLKKSFAIFSDRIVCDSGSEFIFRGLERSRDNIKGWEGVTRCWLEEAQRISADSARILIPTVFREPDSQLWVSFNPERRTDWCWERFVEGRREDDLVRKINYYDNPFLPQSILEECEACRREDPDLYLHVWAGEPDDVAGDTCVLSYRMALACVRAYREGLHRSADLTPVHAGLDIADGGDDRNALCIRRGPVVEMVSTWRSQKHGYLAPTARRADRQAIRAGVWKIYFDASGVGSPMLGELTRLARQPNPAYRIEGINFGQRVAGPEQLYWHGRKNADQFAARNAQMAFALRDRARRTVNLLEGEPEDPNKCLFFSDSIPNLERFLAECTRPQWRNNPTTGKVEIDKRKKTGTSEEIKSPDSYDALALSFAFDSALGLTRYSDLP